MFAWQKDSDQEPGTSLRHSLHEWKVVLALYTSALERKPVEMGSFEPDINLFHTLESVLKSWK